MLAFSLSLFLVIVPTIQQANAASSWSVTKAVSAGSRVIVNATNSGYKSAVNIAPNALKVGAQLARAGNTAYLLYLVTQSLGDGVDWVLDPENNAIKHKTADAQIGVPTYYIDGFTSSTASGACNAYLNSLDTFSIRRFKSAYEPAGGQYFLCLYDIKVGGVGDWEPRQPQGRLIYKDIPAVYSSKPLSSFGSAVAQQAAAGDSRAKELLQSVAVAAVVAGDYDADLLAGAVPINDTKPVIPAVPGSQAGDIDAGMTGGDVGAAADAAREAADAARAAADAALDAYDNAVKDAAKAAADAKDLLNTAIDQAIKDAAAAAAAEAAKVAADAKSAADAAAAAAAEAVKVAADKAVAAAEKSAADARAAADATAESIAAADKAVADAKAAAKEAAEAAKEAAKSAEKPFELPAFCSWATPVCDAVDWLMKPAPDLGDDTELDIDTPDISPVDTDINFGGSCPANFEVNSSIFGNPINITLFETSKFCSFLSTFVKFPVYAASSLFALYILGGRKDV